jgi:hypothetical protein
MQFHLPGDKVQIRFAGDTLSYSDAVQKEWWKRTDKWTV